MAAWRRGFLIGGILVIKTIEIDCAPGNPRPDSYIKGVMENSGVEFDGREPIGKLFGQWTWDFSDISDDIWQKAQEVFAKRLTELYNFGAVRYASW
jgi:hypothetical protein